jgi:DNA-binding response OmpR family regulator
VPASPAQRTILVVEDEDAIAQAIANRLRAEGFRVELSSDGLDAVEACNRLAPDLVVLDLMLPGLDGLEVCRRIQTHRAVPVLMLTARDSETDMLVGLAVGADDYLTKPFSPRELVARVYAILRRVTRNTEASNADATVIRHGILQIDLTARRAYLADEVVHLTPTEFDLLAHLATRHGAVCTRDRLLAEVWGYADGSGPRTVDSHVRALRRKLGPTVVRTVHGVGYAIGDEATDR